MPARFAAAPESGMFHVASQAAALSLLLASHPGAARSHAPAVPVVFDPAGLPSAAGRVLQYSLTPAGDVDGLILDDGTEIHLPPRLGPQLADTVKPGDAVTAHGLRARAVPMMQAVTITNDATGRTVTDDGPSPGMAPAPAPRGDRLAMTAQGRVRLQLHGPRGDLNGALLADGTIIRLPPAEAQRLAALLQPGLTLVAQGPGVAGPFGRVLEAVRLGNGPGTMTVLPPAPSFPPPR